MTTPTIEQALRDVTEILSRYVVEVPLGHQPHTAVLQAQEALVNARSTLAAHEAEPSIEKAVAAERERCARLCETADGFRDQREHGGKLAALIRKDQTP